MRAGSRGRESEGEKREGIEGERAVQAAAAGLEAKRAVARLGFGGHGPLVGRLD